MYDTQKGTQGCPCVRKLCFELCFRSVEDFSHSSNFVGRRATVYLFSTLQTWSSSFLAGSLAVRLGWLFVLSLVRSFVGLVRRSKLVSPFTRASRTLKRTTHTCSNLTREHFPRSNAEFRTGRRCGPHKTPRSFYSARV